MKKELKFNILNKIVGDYRSIILFGSHARGDAKSESDVDVLQVTSESHSAYKVGNIAYSPYSIPFLKKLASEGSLFILHIITEGIEITANTHVLREIKAAFKQRENFDSYKIQLVKTADLLLKVEQTEYDINANNYNRLAAFLFRSLLYAIAYDRGKLAFSIDRLAEKLDDPLIPVLLKLKNSAVPDFEKFNQIRNSINNYAEMEGVDLEILRSNDLTEEEDAYVSDIRHHFLDEEENEIY